MFHPFLTSGSGAPQHQYMVPQADVSQQPLYPLSHLYQAQQGLPYTAMHYPSGGVPIQVGNPQLPGRALLGASHMTPTMSHGYNMHQSSVTSPQKTYQFSWNEEGAQASQSVGTGLTGTQDQSRMASVTKRFTERVKADRFMEIALKRGIMVSAAEGEPSVTPGVLESNTGCGTPSQNGDDSDVNSIVSGKEDTDTHTDSGSIDNTDAKSSTSEGCLRKSEGCLSDFSNEFAKVIIEDACCELNNDLNVNAVPFNPMAFSSKLDATAEEFLCRFTAEDASSSVSRLNPDSPEFKPSFFRDKANNRPDQEDTAETEASDELEVCRLFKKNQSAGVDINIADAPTPEAEAPKAQAPKAEAPKVEPPESVCQSDSLFVNVAVNTKRVRVNDMQVQTPLAFEPRDVGVNTDEVCFNETSDFFTPEMPLNMKSRGVNACVETRCQQVQASLRTKVKSQGVQVGLADDLTAKQCDVCPEKDVQLIEAQMQVCHLKAQICISEMQRQVDDLQHSKIQITSFFSPQSGVDSLTDMVDTRIVWLQEEIAQTKVHLMNCLKDLQRGRPLAAIPAFGISLPTMMGNEVYTPKELKFLRSPSTDVDPESENSKIYAHEAHKAFGDNVCPQKTMPSEEHLASVSPQKTVPSLKNIPPYETLSFDGGTEGVVPQLNMHFELGFEKMSPYKSMPVHETKNTVLQMQSDTSRTESASHFCESQSLKEQECDVSEINVSGSVKGHESDCGSVRNSEAETSTRAVQECPSVASGSDLLNFAPNNTLSVAVGEVTASSSETAMAAALESGSSRESLFSSVPNSEMISSLSSCEDDKRELMSSQCSSKSTVSESASAHANREMSENESQYASGETSLSLSQGKASDPDTGNCVEKEDICVDIFTKKSEGNLSLPCNDDSTDNVNVTFKTGSQETKRTDISVCLDSAQKECESNQNGENMLLPKHESKASSLRSFPKPIPPLPLRLPPRNRAEFASSPDRTASQDSVYETASSSLSSTPVATVTEEKVSVDTVEKNLDALKLDKSVPPGFLSIQKDIEEDIADERDIDSDIVKKVQTVLQNYQPASEKGKVDAESSIYGSPIKSRISPHKQQNNVSPDKLRSSLSPNKPEEILPHPDVPKQSPDKVYKMVNRDSGDRGSVVSHLKATAMKRLGVRHAVADEEPSPDHSDMDLSCSGNQDQGSGLPRTETPQENFNTNHHIDSSDSSEINHPQVHPIQPIQHQLLPNQQESQQHLQQPIQPDQLNPNLFQAVLTQVVKAYPQLASNPVMLQTVCIQQTMVLQSYMNVPAGAPGVQPASGMPGTDLRAQPETHPKTQSQPENFPSIHEGSASPLGHSTNPLQAPVLSEAVKASTAVGNTRPADTAQSGGAGWNPVGLVNMMQARRGGPTTEQAAVSDIKTQNPDMFKFEATPLPNVKTCGKLAVQPVISGSATDSDMTPPGLRSYLLKDRRSIEAAAVNSTDLSGQDTLTTKDVNPFKQHTPPSLTKTASQRKRSTTKPRRGDKISPVTHDSKELFPSVQATHIKMDEDWEEQCEKYPEEFTCTQDVKRPVRFRPVDPPRFSDEDLDSQTSSRSATPEFWDQPYRSRNLSLSTNSSYPRSRSGSFKGRSTTASQKQASGSVSDIQSKSQSSSSGTPTEEFNKMATSVSGNGTQGFKDFGQERNMSNTGLDEIKDFDLKTEHKPNKPDANFLGRLLRSNANINEKLKNEKKKNKGREKPELKQEPSHDEEDDWQTVSMKKRKREQARVEPAASMALVTVTSKGPSKAPRNNFEKLVEHLTGHFPFLSRPEVIELVTSIRSQRGGLTGMKLNDIVEVGRGIVQKKMMAKLEHESVPKATTTAPSQKGGNIYNTLEFQKYYETSRKQLPHRPAIMSPGDSLNDEDVCPICFEDFSVAKKQRLDCGHEFHIKCIREWVLGHERTCPTCRRYTLFQEEFPRLK
ncbi:streptococcal hemagglutinin-like isoform X2 [Haliotis asinina]|uniref:streptococcal hemagglutinin-like isoform X2 n=1 Tax=Haliotis asinina TaxID=109174 RepID=UPI003531E341